MLSNTTVTLHHLALLCIRCVQPEYKYAEYLSSVQIEGCLAGLDVDAMVCMLTQGDGWTLIGRTGCIRCATHDDASWMWRTNSTSCLIAQLMITKYDSIFQQALSVSDIFTNSEPNAHGGFLSVLHVGSCIVST